MAEEDADFLRDPDHADNCEKVMQHVARVSPGLDQAAVLSAIDRGQGGGGASGRFWTMDPIDGTKGFIRGDQYAVALALIENGEVVLGVLGCPNLPIHNLADATRCGVLLYAARGGGACGLPLGAGAPYTLAVSEVVDVADAAVCQSVEAAHTAHGRSAQIADRLGITAAPVGMDSQCKYGIVARGEASIYMRLPGKGSTYEEKIWDHAAGLIIVQEAGGRVTDIAGNPLDFSLGRTLKANQGVIATNGPIHDQVIQAVQAVTSTV